MITPMIASITKNISNAIILLMISIYINLSIHIDIAYFISIINILYA